jgi:hypothetical protein
LSFHVLFFFFFFFFFYFFHISTPVSRPDIGGASWVEMPARKYFLVEDAKRESNCTIEAQISYAAKGIGSAPIFLSFCFVCSFFVVVLIMRFALV